MALRLEKTHVLKVSVMAPNSPQGTGIGKRVLTHILRLALKPRA